VKSIGTILFLLAWITGVVSWIYAIVEIRRIRKRNPRVFGRGPILMRFSEQIISKPSGVAFETKTAAVIPLSGDAIGFVPRMRSLLNPLEGLRRLSLYTAVVSPIGGQATVVVRAPLGFTTFIGAWLVGWLSFAIFLGPFTDCRVNGLEYPAGSAECTSVGIVPPLVVVIVVAFLTWGIRRRARAHFAEILDHGL